MHCIDTQLFHPTSIEVRTHRDLIICVQGLLLDKLFSFFLIN